MAGKSNKGRSKGKPVNSKDAPAPAPELKPVESVAVKENADVTEIESVAVKDVAVKENAVVAEIQNGVADAAVEAVAKPSAEVAGSKAEAADAAKAEPAQAEGEVHLYPVSVKIQSGEKLELQLSPKDSVIDVRQFLLDAPETNYFTCYDLVLHTKDGSTYHVEDHNEISEVADITQGGCSLEMVAAPYDDRSIRVHVHRARELISLSNLHTSLSTLLALQHETTQQKTAVPVKVETPDLDGLGFMDDVPSSLHNFIKSQNKEIKCVESIVFSSFNPPPSYRRLVGDLIYIDVTTLEGNNFCVTGTTEGFYVNSSLGDILDPKQLKLAYEASTLIGLLQKISSKFKKGFREIVEWKAAAHPFENVQSILSPNSWLGAYPLTDHKRDAARAEDAVTLSYGSELIGMQRDWNEELQSCREFPHTSSQERILRDRALYKVTCDFVDAATNGAVGVINRCIPPINPTDPECFHMYVHNNLFFSFAVDADLAHISEEGVNFKFNFVSNRVESTNFSPDPSAKPPSNSCRSTTSDSSQFISGTSSTEGFQVAAEIISDIDFEAKVVDSERATYASANNDLKGTKAYQEADVPGLYILAMAIVDYRGYRVVAQSIIPGILQGDKSDSLLYGSVDNGKKIYWNESFHSKVLEAAKRLHLKEHTVKDGAGNDFKLAAPVECKGIIGSDERHYLLDLIRVTPRDANYNGSGSRFCILRPELVASFCQAEAAERPSIEPKTGGEIADGSLSQAVAKSDMMDTPTEIPAKTDNEPSSVPAKTDSDSASVPVKSCKLCDVILLNPNVFTEFKLADSQEEIVADEAFVRKASSYLLDVIIPKFVNDLSALEVSPMDGQTLTDAFHAHGINIRYLGKVANMTKKLPHLWDLCAAEIVVRSAKHILKGIMRESQDHDLGSAISHFLNCFIGRILHVGRGPYSIPLASPNKSQESHQSPRRHTKGKVKSNNGAPSRKSRPAHMVLTSEGLWSYLQEFARSKYQFEFPEDVGSKVRKVSVIRNLCQKVGITVAARKYDLDASAPFHTSDILNLQPVVKHMVPMCSEANDLIDMGKAQLAEGLLNEAYTFFSEAFSILQQVTGPMHREVANCCRYLAMVLYHAGDMAGAIMQQHKELIINERCLGLDHPDTAHSYGNMALFYHGLNQTDLALRHMSRTLLLLSMSSGPDHPDVAATFINVAMMYQDIGNMNTVLRYLQEALKKNERLLGPEHIQTAVCYHALAIAFNCMGAYKLSIQHEKKTYDILVKQLGEDDSRTNDSQHWVKTFKLREQQANAQKQKGQVVDPVSAQKAIEFLKAASGNVSTSISKSFNAALLGEALPRGRGVDERAARAAAEIRKKAAAKGLLGRPSAVPSQSLAQLANILNIINSAANTPEPASNTEAGETKKASNGPTSNGVVKSVKDANGTVEGQGDEAPVGLGSDFASLNSKKQKSKPKPNN